MLQRRQFFQFAGVAAVAAAGGAASSYDGSLIERDGSHERFDDADGITGDILKFVESALRERSASVPPAFTHADLLQHTIQQLCVESTIQ